jgi:hypothetical protein
MHPEAYDFINREIGRIPYQRVIEFGSRDVNGGVRGLFPKTAEKRFPDNTRYCYYIGVDRCEGAGVDVVGAAEWFQLPKDALPPELVVCCEVLEHTSGAEAIIKQAAELLRTASAPNRGSFLMTCATNPREPHSAVDGGPLRELEFYRNVTPDTAALWLSRAEFTRYIMDVNPRGDLYVHAWA